MSFRLSDAPLGPSAPPGPLPNSPRRAQRAPGSPQDRPYATQEFLGRIVREGGRAGEPLAPHAPGPLLRNMACEHERHARAHTHIHGSKRFQERSHEGPSRPNLDSFTIVLEGFWPSDLCGCPTLLGGPGGLRDRPQTAPEAPKAAPRRSRRAQGWPKKRPGQPTSAPKQARDQTDRARKTKGFRLKRAPGGPGSSQEASNMARDASRSTPKRVPTGQNRSCT